MTPIGRTTPHISMGSAGTVDDPGWHVNAFPMVVGSILGSLQTLSRYRSTKKRFMHLTTKKAQWLCWFTSLCNALGGAPPRVRKGGRAMLLKNQSEYFRFSSIPTV